jgi:colanic acid/amylovoran biosynthesis glycosyltransferase
MMARASVFALPCVDEEGGGKDNLPTVITEAMAAAVPVISTSVAGVPEMVEDGITGWLVPQHDPSALARRLCDILDDSAAAVKMGAAGRLVCETKFATKRTTEQLRGILADHDAFKPATGGWLSRMIRGGG